MYERWTVGDIETVPSGSYPPLQPMTNALPANDNFSPGYPTTPFAYSYDSVIRDGWTGMYETLSVKFSNPCIETV
jgi:hypothetical protein